MKFKLLFLAAVSSLALFSGCLRDECTSEQTYTRYDPVYKSVDEIRKDPVFEPARALRAPGKIYAIGDYLFINEIKEGIHVIDNADPTNPKNIAFWNIPGNVDMVVRNHYLYVDQYVDLLTLDIEDLANPKVVCRAENVFPAFGFDNVNGFLIDYKQTEVTEKVKCGASYYGQQYFLEGDVLWVDSNVAAEFDGGPRKNVPSGVGVAGSFSRFGIASDYLYTVDNYMLRSWNLGNPACPARVDSVWLGWNPETIFPFKDRLFIGTQTGVFIFNNSNPAHPVQETVFDHASGCDPVVCDDNNAYVTIHDGTTCNGTFNQLDVVDIQNLPVAKLVQSYPMTRPFGLSLTNDHLFLCDDGLKIFDRSTPTDLKQIGHLPGIDSYDVIALTDTQLLLIGADGFFQYDVTNPASPKELSRIPVEK